MPVRTPRPIAISVEVFPPKTTEGLSTLGETCDRLATLRPEFVSVTCPSSPGGPERTYETAKAIRSRLDPAIGVAPHLTCVGSTERSRAPGRLRGASRCPVHRDPGRPAPPGARSPAGDFAHASDLVAFIRAEGSPRVPLVVAAHPEVHPEAPSARADLAAFQHKGEAGANFAITQYGYTMEAYLQLRGRVSAPGRDPADRTGIIPIANYERLGFSAIAGVEIPRWLRKWLDDVAGEPATLRAFGLEVVSRLCQRRLAGGAPCLHFYTMNDAAPTLAICERLGLPLSKPGAL
jgi:methylenetetrahydrofolate reductase (NADPH)